MNKKLVFGSVLGIVVIVFSLFLFLPMAYSNSVNMNVIMHGCSERGQTRSMGVEDPSAYENEANEYQFNSNYQDVQVNGNTVTVSYNVSHLCGAKIETEKQIRKGEITLTTKISGGNRCGDCVSEIIAELEPVPAGDYHVNVKGIMTDFDAEGLIYSKDISVGTAP
ncbi:MAG: hypothetical protein V1735_07085 [Nanoarchaeota archaeon]